MPIKISKIKLFETENRGIKCFQNVLFNFFNSIFSLNISGIAVSWSCFLRNLSYMASCCYSVQLECEYSCSSHCRVIWLPLVRLHLTPSLKPSSPQTFSERDSDSRILYFHHKVPLRGLLLHLISSNNLKMKCVCSVPCDWHQSEFFSRILLLLPLHLPSFIKSRIGYYE